MAAITNSGPGTALAPTSTGGAPAPTGGNVPTPATGAGNAVSREVQRPAGGAVATNLSAHSWLDEIRQEMTLLNDELGALNEALGVLKKSSEALDAIITNVDELGNLYEAPATTRSALNADSAVATLIDNLVAAALQHGHQARVLNAQGFLALRVVNQVQDNQRAMGAGPRLLASAGRL
jgi:hypothetical protein